MMKVFTPREVRAKRFWQHARKQERENPKSKRPVDDFGIEVDDDSMREASDGWSETPPRM